MTIQEICGCVMRVSPINRRGTGLGQKGPHNIVNCAKDALSTSVLLGGVWARYPEGDPMSEEERACQGVVKLATVVAQNSLNGGVKLCAHIREKSRNDTESIGFKAQWKGPGVRSAVIKKN
jgi:hypothetical protein